MTAVEDRITEARLTKGEATRQAILAAAIARFGRDGYRATSVADIARAAGVGGTAAYAYFDGKEALFLAAIDHDAAAVIHEGLDTVLVEAPAGDWRQTLIIRLVAALEGHPLARRLLAGREPEVTERVLGIPALEDLRVACADRIRLGQELGLVRTDVDPTALANGIVSIVLAILMAVVQVGPAATTTYTDDVVAVFGAALDAPTSGG